MAKHFEIIARYTEGVARFMIGRKIDPEKPLDEGNVQWLEQDGHPVAFENYRDAELCLKR